MILNTFDGYWKTQRMIQTKSKVNWNLTTWEGSRREQLRRACRLTLREKLMALDDMQDFASHFQKLREKRNLPVID
jgi:hypothetical protein